MEVQLKVPQETIDRELKNLVAAGVVSALEKNAGQVLQQLVTQALNEEDRDSYPRESKFMKAAKAAILEVAKAEAKAWIEAKKPEITKAIREKLKRGDKDVVQRLVDQLLGGLDKFQVNVSLEEKRGD